MARRIAVIGGGISGLAAAWFVAQREADADITVFEGSPRLGGKLAVGEVGGVQVDLGAESILNRRPEAVDLARAVGLADDLVHPATATASVWSRGELVPMPRGHLMGVPGDPAALAGLLTGAEVEDAERAARDTEIRLDRFPHPPEAADVSVGAYVAGQLGPGVVDRLVEPLLGGVYAGHAGEISLRAAIPLLYTAFQHDTPLTEAVRDILAKQARNPNPQPVFAGVRGGVGRFPAVLAGAAGKLGVRIRTGTPVRELARTATGWRLVSGPVPQPEAHDVDAVVLAVPATPTAKLLRDLAPAAAAELSEIEYASVALATYVFEKVDGLPGSGFLVPPVDGRFIKASTFSSVKWDWVAESGHTVLRASVGRHREAADLQRDDAELAALALADLREAVGLTAEPIDWQVQRWGGGLPQYAVGHVDRVARIRTAVSGLPNLAVCGAAYDGVGIAACVASAMAAAERVTAGAASGRENN